MERRKFLRNLAWSSAAISASSLLAVDPYNKRSLFQTGSKPLRISLAQWSLHRQFFAGDLDARDFAAIAVNTYGIKAVEYVNGFYVDSAQDEKFWQNMRERADQSGAESLLIMVDDEGDLGDANQNTRQTAVENHYKWVNAAKILGCHSVRVNAFGDSDREIFRASIIDGMSRLTDYAAQENINIIIENHGLFSSDAKLITEIVKTVNKPNFGTFPDFGNWCLSAKWGSTQNECDRVYDRYQGVAEFLPYAKAVSAKSYNFNEQGEDRIIDYYKMLEIVKESDYEGYIGIEYEGVELPEHEGILATKALMEKAWANI